eukprot:3590001-Pleurochrysis_carterae.AAC.1
MGSRDQREKKARRAESCGTTCSLIGKPSTHFRFQNQSCEGVVRDKTRQRRWQRRRGRRRGWLRRVCVCVVWRGNGSERASSVGGRAHRTFA